MAQTETWEQVQRLGEERLHPSLTNPNWLILRKRRKLFAEWLGAVPCRGLSVLDVGGRIQPYRQLLGNRAEHYTAIDLQTTPAVDVRANACNLPFAAATFDLVLCTQVLEYLPEPQLAVAEIYRVLKPGGNLLLSVAAFYPRAVDQEHWRFLPAGLRHLLRAFRVVEIKPEGSSISGFFRGSNVCFNMFARHALIRRFLTLTVVPSLNVLALLLEQIAGTSNDQATGNYSGFAQK